MNNLICVKWGTLYGPEYVINLYNSAKRNTEKKFQFHVFTDSEDNLPHKPDWTFHRLPNWNLSPAKAWFYKMEIFNGQHGMLGRNLYMDLDVIISGNLDSLWEYKTDHFVICQDFNRVYIKNYRMVNSSVMAWNGNSLQHVYDSFTADRNHYAMKYRGDQDYINDAIPNRETWPTAWTQSYRWEVWRGGIQGQRPSNYALEEHRSVIPWDCRVIAFHGKPKPHEITEPLLRDKWLSP